MLHDSIGSNDVTIMILISFIIKAKSNIHGLKERGDQFSNLFLERPRKSQAKPRPPHES